MKLANEILVSAFHSQRVSCFETAERIGQLATTNGQPLTDIDRAVIAEVDAIQALLVGYDPRQQAGTVFRHCQEISLGYILDDIGYGKTGAHRRGISSQLAVHGLLWWGIFRRPDFGGRYARFTTNSEDSSSPGGRKNGVDMIFRTERRRHQVQVKSTTESVKIDIYEDDIVGVSPPMLLGDSRMSALDMHTAIFEDDAEVLDGAINRFVRELRTQRARNGSRRVI